MRRRAVAKLVIGQVVYLANCVTSATVIERTGRNLYSIDYKGVIITNVRREQIVKVVDPATGVLRDTNIGGVA